MPNAPALALVTPSTRSPLAEAAATGAAILTPARLFESLTAGDDFGGFDAFTEALAVSRDTNHVTAHEYGALMDRLAEAVPESERAALVRLDSMFTLRVACAVEVGFHAGVAAGRVR
jgi:hypothetical protein